MTSDVALARPKVPSFDLGEAFRSYWPLIVGFALLAIPTLITLAQQSWSTELGAHGPIVLATGAWLLLHERERYRSAIAPANDVVIALALVIALPLYAFGRAYDMLALEAVGLYIAGLACLYAVIGARAMVILAFPLLYFGFLIPPPGWLIDSVTAPLQAFISMVATNTLSFFGYPVERSGVTIFIAQYQLLVEQACSGLNSLMGLVAITIFYIYIMHQSTWRYALLLAVFILPIAILANIVRILTLILITYYFGDAAAQGFLHVTAGIVLFTLALFFVFALDSLLQRFFLRRRVVR